MDDQLLKAGDPSSWNLNQLSNVTGGLQASSDFNDVYRKAKDLHDQSIAHFAQWDEDDNDLLSLSEIQWAKQNTSDRATLTQLSILENGYETFSAADSHDTWFSGISKRDLDLSVTFLEPGRTNYDLEKRLMATANMTLIGGWLSHTFFGVSTFHSGKEIAGIIPIAISRYPMAALAVGAVAGIAAGVGMYFNSTEKSREHLEKSRDSIANLLRSATY